MSTGETSIMAYIRLTEEQKKEMLNALDVPEKECLQTAEAILQKIAGVYINTPGNPEMADFYRNAADALSELRIEMCKNV